MKLYSKNGDTGKTSLIDGTRVSKDNCNICLLGNIDELNSYIGLIRASIPDNESLKEIQQNLFNIGSLLACGKEESFKKLPQITEEHVASLEVSIDKMNEVLPNITHFILPGGVRLSAEIHIARTICRKAEREVVKYKDGRHFMIVKYLNRLSDWLFVLARFTNMELGGEELFWKPRT